MADINIERKRRSGWLWLLLLIIAIGAVAAWWFLGPGRNSLSTAVGVDTTAPAAEAPAYSPPTAPPYPAAGDTTPRDTLNP